MLSLVALTVLGTLALGSDGYYLSSNHGSCRGRWERPWMRPDVEVSCAAVRSRIDVPTPVEILARRSG
jgi:hypothetical protein